MKYNFAWFHPNATRVTCNVWDAKANIQICTTGQMGHYILEFKKLYIHIQIGGGYLHFSHE